MRLSGPIKTHWAKFRGLDIDQLLGHGEYKEKYRLQMSKWGEDLRNKDYGYFCRAAIDMYNGTTAKGLFMKDCKSIILINFYVSKNGTSFSAGEAGVDNQRRPAKDRHQMVHGEFWRRV